MPRTQPADTSLLRRRDWLTYGACRHEDPELFFPITARGPSSRQILAAKAVCARCPVQRECLSYALQDRHSSGIWGGTTEEERQAMRRARARANRSLPAIRAVAG